MDAASHAQLSEDRRFSSPTRQALMSRLTMSQKFAVNSLNQYGYNLEFVRIDESSSMAVMMAGSNIATVDAQGDINTSPELTIRGL